MTHDIAEMGGNVAVLDLRDEPKEPVFDLPAEFGVKVHYFSAMSATNRVWAKHSIELLQHWGVWTAL